MPLDIRKPKSVPYLRTLLMGPAKVGKTTFVGTSDFKTLVLDFEGGEAVLPTKDSLDVISMKSILTMNEVHTFLTTEDHGYEMLVLDSITSANRIAFLELLTAESTKHARREENRAEIQDYVVIQNLMTRMVYELLQLPMHIILTAHPKSIVHPEIGTKYVPLLSPTKMPEVVLGMMNEIVFLAMDKESTRYLLLRNYPEYSVESRVRREIDLPEEITDPTMAKYFDALRGQYVSDGDKPNFSTLEERKLYADQDTLLPTTEDN